MKTGKIVKIVLALAIVFIVFKIIQAYRHQGASAYSTMGPMMEEFESYDPREIEYATIAAQKNDTGTGPGLTPQPGGTTPKPLPGWKSAPMSISTDLLPRDDPKVDDFGEFAPKQVLAEKNFLEATKLIGMDTISGSLKNPNMSLRADPPIKKADNLSPWLNSTFDADPLRKKLDC